MKRNPIAGRDWMESRGRSCAPGRERVAGKKILITGISGLLGSNLAHHFKSRNDILGLFNGHPVSLDGVRTREADILSETALRSAVDSFRPDIIIHCASLTNVDQCEVDRDRTDLVNVTGTRNVVASAEDRPVRIVYISSDSVYEGVKGDYSETDPVAPRNHYGMSKYRGELEVMKRADSLVIRTNIFGWNVQPKFSIAEWILHELNRGARIQGFTDAFFSSIYTFELARVLDRALERELSGVYNCASRDSVSKYDFARMVAEVFKLDGSLVDPISIDDFNFQAKRGKNLSLDSSKMSGALDLRMPAIRDSVEAFHRDFRSGLSGRIGERMIPDVKEKPFLSYGRQSIDEDDIRAVVDALKSSNLTQGPRIAEFEGALCRSADAPFSVACNSGTSALHMACLAAGVQPGDEVITSPVTFVASANCAVYCGAKPVFADIDPRTFNITPEEVERKATGKTRVVIPVHFAGQSCDMAGIREAVRAAERKHGNRIFIVEDACHALGSEYRGAKVGSCAYGDMAVTSFHPVKHITTGEGGAVFTASADLHGRLRRLRSHGITSDPGEFLNRDMAFASLPGGDEGKANPWYYEQIALGFNYRITDIQCALGISQLNRFEAFRKRRREIVGFYNRLFAGMDGVTTPYEAEDCESNFHLYVLLFDFDRIGTDRATFMTKLREEGIQTQVHYIPVHLQPYYRMHFGTKPGDCPNAEHYYSRCLSVPLHPVLADADIERVVDEIGRLVGRKP